MFLGRLYEVLRYTALPLTEIFRRLSYESAFAPLRWLQAYRREDATLCCPPSGADAEETAFLTELFSPLGKSDLDGQLAHIDYLTTLSGEKEASAEKKRQNGVKLYLVSGACAGLCMALLLL